MFYSQPGIQLLFKINQGLYSICITENQLFSMIQTLRLCFCFSRDCIHGKRRLCWLNWKLHLHFYRGLQIEQSPQPLYDFNSFSTTIKTCYNSNSSIIPSVTCYLKQATLAQLVLQDRSCIIVCTQTKEKKNSIQGDVAKLIKFVILTQGYIKNEGYIVFVSLLVYIKCTVYFYFYEL